MSRVKRGVMANKSRKNILSQVKGYRNGRSTKLREAITAIYHAGNHAFAARRDKKNDFRKLWNVRINAAVRPLGTTYSQFIGNLKRANIGVDRKIMSTLAQDYPTVFQSIVSKANEFAKKD